MKPMTTSDFGVLERFDSSSFYRDFVLPRKPAVVRGGVSDWNAIERWTPEFFREEFGDRKIPSGKVSIGSCSSGEGSTTFSKYLDELQAAEDDQRVPSIYLRNAWLQELLPELSDDAPIPSLAQPNWLEDQQVLGLLDPRCAPWASWREFFLSGSGVRYPHLHFDYCLTHAWMAQVLGTKQVYLWPPLQGQTFLYLGRQLRPVVETTIVTQEADLNTLMAHAEPISVMLNPGDLAFVPAGWWHTTETTSLSITVSGNFVNDSNWKAFLVLARHEGLLDLSDATTDQIDEVTARLSAETSVES